MTAADRSEAAWAHDLLDALLAAAANGDDVESGTDHGSAAAEWPLRADQLRPIVAAHAEVEWLVTNGDRVDAVLQAGESRWRLVFGSTDRIRVDWINVIARPARFEGIAGGTLVVINGPSGAGKSTLMQALQKQSSEPWVTFDEPEHIGSVQDVLLDREHRSDRWGGIAAESMRVHEGWTYDLTFDTSAAPEPADMAAQVDRRLPNP